MRVGGGGDGSREEGEFFFGGGRVYGWEGMFRVETPCDTFLETFAVLLPNLDVF